MDENIVVNLENGLVFEIRKDAVNDWRLAELFADLEENPFKTVTIAKFLLTPESYEKLKTENLDKDTGHIDANGVESMLMDIITASGDTKK